MKRAISFLLLILAMFSLSACSFVDTKTAKSEELTAQYDYYSDSVHTIRTQMKITPEQADEVFLIMTGCGLDEKITYIFDNSDGGFKVWYGLKTFDVTMDNGIVAEIKSGKSILYPEPEASEPGPEEEPKDDETSKETARIVALALDSQIYECVLNSDKAIEILQSGILLVGEGEGSLLELYDLAKAAKETEDKLFANLLSLSDDNTKAYVDACQMHVMNNKTVAEKLIKYIDKQEMKYLSDAKEALESTTQYALSVINERMKYLSAQGISDEEIAEILTAESDPAA